MQLQQLIQAQRAIETFFYRVRVNIALHDILNSKEHSEFKKKMNAGIKAQLIHFATTDKIDQLLEVKKVDGKPDEDSIFDNINPLFLGLLVFVASDDIQRYLEYSAKRGGTSAYHLLEIDGQYVLTDSMKKLIAQRIPELVGFLDETTQKWLARLVARAAFGGASSYEIAKLLRDQARKIAQIRSEIIAENEAAVYLGEATLEVYKDNGVDYKRLITSRDERVCPICIADEDAGDIPLNQAFPSGRVFTPIHIGCRCFVLPVTKTPIPVEP